MNTIFFSLLFIFLGVNCSRISFQKQGEPGPEGRTAVHTVDSLSCSADSLEPCDESEGGRANSQFFRTGREENSPGHLTEYFEIPHREELEIIMVLDVSRSMDKNLKKTGQNMMALLSHIQHRKWRMAWTTADHGDHIPMRTSYRRNSHKIYPQERWQAHHEPTPRFGKFMQLEKRGKVLDQLILHHDTPHHEQIFKDTFTRENPRDCRRPPYCQGAHEQPLRSLQSAFLRYQTDLAHQRFFQPNTDTVAIIITDEDERQADRQNATSAKEVIGTFRAVFKGKRKRLFGFSISIQDEKCMAQEGYGTYGRKVGRLAELTLGKDIVSSHRGQSGNISLCSKDYGYALTDISQITRAVTESLTLEKMFYITETVEVQLTPAQPEVTWHFYGRKLVFSKSILPGTKVRVSYRYEQATPARS